MSIVDTDRAQVERIATLARLTLQAVRDALVKARISEYVEPVLSDEQANRVFLQITDPGYLGYPAPAIQNYDVPAGFLEAESDFIVRFYPHTPERTRPMEKHEKQSERVVDALASLTIEELGQLFQTAPADPEDVNDVLDGEHSEPIWLRLPNGDLVLGVYPQGEETYFAAVGAAGI